MMKFSTLAALCSLSLIGFHARYGTAIPLCKRRQDCSAVIGCDVTAVKEHCECPKCPMKAGEHCGMQPCRSGLVCMMRGQYSKCEKQTDLQIKSSDCVYSLKGYTIEGKGIQFYLYLNHNQCKLEIMLGAKPNVIRFKHGRASVKPQHMYVNGTEVKNGNSVTVPKPQKVVLLQANNYKPDMEIDLFLPINQTMAFEALKAKCGDTANLMIRHGQDEVERPYGTAIPLCRRRQDCSAVNGCDVTAVKEHCECPKCPMKAGEHCGMQPCRSGLVCMMRGQYSKCEKQSDLQIKSSDCVYSLNGYTIEGKGMQFYLYLNHNQCKLEIMLSAKQNVIRFKHGRASVKPQYMYVNGTEVKNGNSVTVPKPQNVVLLQASNCKPDMEIDLFLPVNQVPSQTGSRSETLGHRSGC